MSNKVMQTRMMQKNDTSENWAKATNFVPLKGEIIIYTDLNKMKIGDGETNVRDLPFAGSQPPSKGLAYELSGDGTYAICKGIGTCTETDIIIASTYEGKPVTEISLYAFYDGCRNIKSITIPDSVTSIGFYALYGCVNLESLTIPFVGAMKDEIGNNTHLGYIFGAATYNVNGNFVPTSLKTVVITNGCTSIGASAFYGCTNLTSIIIPDSVTSIGYEAFSGCTGLTSIEIPEGVRSIGWSAFSNCTNLKSIIIPDSVTSIGDDTFWGCSSLFIYCEATEQPAGWSDTWNSDNRPVVWGVALDIPAINNKLVIKPGETNNSAVLSGEYEGYTNEAISQVSMALGAASTAGLKGWYYEHANIENRQLFLTKKKPSTLTIQYKVPLIGTILNPDESYIDKNFNSGYSIGDTVSLVFGSKYERYTTIEAIDGNVITLKEALPFTNDNFIAGTATTLGTDPDEFAIYSAMPIENDDKTLTVKNYNVGEVDFGGGSHAEGVQTYAINIGTHAEGVQTVAYGQYAHTEGFKTEAGYSAHAEGVRGKAIGEGSHAEGLDTIAKGNFTHAEGNATEAIADYAHTEGYKVKAKGVRSHAEGDIEPTDDATKSLTYNISGKDVTFDLAETATTAAAVVSHREGRNTQAVGRYSHVEGSGSISYGSTTHAEGYKNIAVGNNSHAEGKYTRANGNSSHSSGIGTVADAEAQTVVGTYNIPDTTAKFVVGVGIEGKPENAFTAGNTTADGNYFTLGDIKVTEDQLASTLAGQGGSTNVASVDYDKTIKAIAHRGYSAGAPENTISAFIMAKEQGFNYVECDVAFTKDNVPVLLHDMTIDRTSNGTGNIKDLTYDQVKDLDFGSWFSPKYNGEKIPTFAEFLNTCKRLGLYAYIELKETTSNSGSFTESQVEQVIQLVEEYGMTDNVCYISFNLTNLTYAHNINPKARLGYCRSVDITDTDVTNIISLRGTNEVFIDIKLAALTSTGINKLISDDIPVEVWTVDNPNDLSALPNYVSGVTSNCLIAGKVLSELTQAQLKKGHFNIIRVLTGCYSDKTQVLVKDGLAYEETFIPEFGYSISNATVSITMGGVNITPSFKNGQLNIAEVTGDIVINIAAKALAPVVDIDLTTISGDTLLNKVLDGSNYNATLGKGTNGSYSADAKGLTLKNHAYANVNYGFNASTPFTIVVTGKLVTKNNNVYQRLFRTSSDAPSVYYWDHDKNNTSIIYNYFGAKLTGLDGGSTLTSHSNFTQTIGTQNSLYTITDKFNSFAEHTYVFTNDGTTISLYIDGILCGTQKSAGMAASTYIGLGENNTAASASYYAAETTFSAFKIFNNCLSAEDIPGLISNSQAPNSIINISNGQAIFGKYNKVDTSASLIVGAGSATNRQNAFTAGNDGTNDYITIGEEKLTEEELKSLKDSGKNTNGLTKEIVSELPSIINAKENIIYMVDNTHYPELLYDTDGVKCNLIAGKKYYIDTSINGGMVWIDYMDDSFQRLIELELLVQYIENSNAYYGCVFVAPFTTEYLITATCPIENIYSVEDDKYKEYMLINNKLQQIGDSSVNTNAYTKKVVLKKLPTSNIAEENTIYFVKKPSGWIEIDRSVIEIEGTGYEVTKEIGAEDWVNIGANNPYYCSFPVQKGITYKVTNWTNWYSDVIIAEGPCEGKILDIAIAEEVLTDDKGNSVIKFTATQDGYVCLSANNSIMASIFYWVDEVAEDNRYDKYILIDGIFEKIGGASIDLSNHVHKDELKNYMTKEEIKAYIEEVFLGGEW